MWAISVERITAPPISENALGCSPTASQTHSGPSTHSSTPMSEDSATGMSRAPAVKSKSPTPSWPTPNKASSAKSPAVADDGSA